MLGWALATFVNGMKIRLRKNWLSILAERGVPQHRNCLWCDESMINYDGYGLCFVWRGLCNQECMNEWACITFFNQARCLGVAEGQFPPPPPWFWPFLLLLLLLVSSVTYGDDDNTHTPIILPQKMSVGKKCVGVPPPPPPPTRWVPFSWLAQCSAIHFARITEVLLALLTCGVVWYW